MQRSISILRALAVTVVIAGSGCHLGPTDSATHGESADRVAPLALPQLPGPRHGHRAHRVDGVVVVFGGFGSGPARSDQPTWTWSPGEASWTVRTKLNIGKAFFSSVVIDEAIYAIGDNVERYDPAADRWEVVSEGSRFPHSHFAADAVGSRLYTVGGFPVERSGVTRFDLATGQIEAAPTLPGFEPGDHFHFAVTLGDQLHVIGGFTEDATGASDQHWVLVGDRWKERARLPEPEGAKFSCWAVFDDRLYIFGMSGSNCYDAELDQWHSISPPPETRAMPATFAHDGRLYVLGGFAQKTIDGILVYDIATDTWSRIHD